MNTKLPALTKGHWWKCFTGQGCKIAPRKLLYIYKLRYKNDTMSFRYKKRENDTELSKYLWKLKEGNTDHNLQWSKKAYASPYKCGTRKCDLCLTEKMIIARSDPKKLLHKRTELVSNYIGFHDRVPCICDATHIDKRKPSWYLNKIH